MTKNKKVIALIAIPVLLIVFFLYTMISQGIFFNKGTKLAVSGSKSYISPGKLLYTSGSDDGAWIVYLKTGQTVVSYLDKQGNKNWQNVYAEPNLNVNSSKNFTIIGESDDKEVKIIDTSGNEVLAWDAKGNPLFCDVNDEGKSIVVSNVMSENNAEWVTNLTVASLKKNGSKYLVSKDLTKDYIDTEFIDVKLWNNGVIALVYNTSEAEKGQYIIILDNEGVELQRHKVDDSVSEINVSPSGDLIVWAVNNIVYKFNGSTNKITELKYKGVVDCGFISDTKLYLISNQTGIIPYGRRVHVSETDLTGKAILKANFPGYLVKSEVSSEGSLSVTTNKGMYNIQGSKGAWYAENDKEVFSSVVLNDIIYLISKDNTLTWYQKP